ncbi:MAG: phosphate signaling complex protein PhoU [Cellulomonadaceae bacterium]|jgi:phosphate transport system protein|nr:phosphate signaling complex protein PhoU [Cellulomonadaceae bacterium]
MRKIFDAEMTAVGEDLIAMSHAVGRAIHGAGLALLNADAEQGTAVVEGDKAIDEMQRSLDERCIFILAQQAPVATDLRTIISALRMSASLERMGDLARHVAEVAVLRAPNKAVRAALEPTFTSMVESAQSVALDVTMLLETRDLDQAAAIERDDDVLDDLHQKTFDVILAEDWDGSVQESVDITLLARYLERFGDHATSIARRIVYLVTGDMDGA